MTYSKSDIKEGIHYLSQRAKRDLLSFAIAMHQDYKVNWHHKAVCKKLDSFFDGDIKFLMLFLQPQSGKSELSSRQLPSYWLGHRPDAKIGITAHTQEHANSFNRDIKRIIDSGEYRFAFPDTTLDQGKGEAKKTEKYFEIVDHNGWLKTVGIGGPLTGSSLDVAIVDDPIKDRKEANSKTYRDRTWNWFTDVLETRLDNHSQVLIVNTRWHYDDLCGRILKRDGRIEDGGKWEVVNFPAILEQKRDDDPREVGEVLWPEKHSRKRMHSIREKNPATFSSMYQGRPTPQEGNLIKRKWFGEYKANVGTPSKLHAYIDSAQTKKEIKSNDPSGILVWGIVNGRVRLVYFEKGYWGLYETIEQLKSIDKAYGMGGFVFIENKSNAPTLRDAIIKRTNLNVRLDKSKVLNKLSKEERVKFIEDKLMSGRVELPDNAPGWLTPFVDHLIGFPNMAHDEEVDCLTGAVRMAFSPKKTGGKVEVI